MKAAVAAKAAARLQGEIGLGLQSSIAESNHCARELDAGVARFRKLLETVAASPFVAHMRLLKASVVG